MTSRLFCLLLIVLSGLMSVACGDANSQAEEAFTGEYQVTQHLRSEAGSCEALVAVVVPEDCIDCTLRRASFKIKSQVLLKQPFLAMVPCEDGRCSDEADEPGAVNLSYPIFDKKIGASKWESSPPPAVSYENETCVYTRLVRDIETSDGWVKISVRALSGVFSVESKEACFAKTNKDNQPEMSALSCTSREVIEGRR